MSLALFLRSLLFNLFLVMWTFILGFTIIFVPLMRLRHAWIIAHIWVKTVLFVLRVTVGLTYEIKGKENIPDGAAVFACKHQSAWETIALNIIVGQPAFVLKQSLLFIPFFGQYLRKLDMIAIDRSSGAQALKVLQRKALQLTNAGRPIIIFPEGTRTKPGHSHKYKRRGVTTLYARLPVPLVPVALNSGLFWPRNSVIKYPGKITVEFLPAIPSGLDDAKFIATLHETIETASERLLQ
jgi:1-acyl-sn-glycerol-3-phosphate acyltransferase